MAVSQSDFVLPNYFPAGQTAKPHVALSPDGEYLCFDQAIRLPNGEWRGIAVRIVNPPQEEGGKATAISGLFLSAIASQTDRVQAIFNTILRAVAASRMAGSIRIILAEFS